MLHFQTAAAGYRLDSQLSAPHRFMTIGSWTCKAGPPSRYRHIFLKLPNRRSFYLLTISIKKHTPSLRSAKPSNHFRKPGGGFWKYVEQGRFLHLQSKSLFWFTWLLAYCFLICFVWPHAMAPAIASDQKKSRRLGLFVFVDSLFARLLICLIACLFVCLILFPFVPFLVALLFDDRCSDKCQNLDEHFDKNH